MSLSFFSCQRSGTARIELSEFWVARSVARPELQGNSVEPTGLEPVTSGLQSQRSPN